MILVDTHALIWWINDSSELSDTARDVLDHHSEIGIAAITCWEVALLAVRRRIELDTDVYTWLDDVTSLPEVQLLPLNVDIAARAAELGATLRDPADCMIVATSLYHRAPVVTADERIRASGLVETIW